MCGNRKTRDMKTIGTIELTKEQREQLVDALADVRQQYGDFEKEVLIGEDLLIVAKGSMDVDCYQENETGAWIETRRSAWVELTAYDENGEECYVDALTEQEADEYLNQAA